MKSLFYFLTGSHAQQSATELSSSAQRVEPRNFFVHVGALTSSKTADELLSPKLVLSWLLTTLGASTFYIGLLVPIRESLSMLPQIFTAGWLRRYSVRKFFWILGSTLQGLAAGGILWSAWTLEGDAAGIAIASFLAVLALARSLCSVSYKDILGRTIDNSRRGATTGLAASFAALLALVFASLLASGFFPRFTFTLFGVATAGFLWLIAALLFSRLHETPAQDNKDEAPSLNDTLQLLRSDPELRRFIYARLALTATALGPPFLVALLPQPMESAAGGLGGLMIASALASILSSYAWGRLADSSSRKVLICAGVLAALLYCGSALASVFWRSSFDYLLPVLIFGIMLCHQGVRLGRSVHLVDMASEQNRAQYTALANTAVGIFLLGSSVLGLIASQFGALAVILVLCVMSGIGAVLAATLREAQRSSNGS